MDLDAIRARLAACPIPEDAQADWDGTNHYEVHDPVVEWCWLDVHDVFGAAPDDWSATKDGKRLGAVLDYACHYKRDVDALLAALDACHEFVVNETDPSYQWILVRKCVGHRLPKPVMWKVALRGVVLAKDGEWECEPMPSGRDEAFYARCRFDTFEEAWKAALDAQAQKESDRG